MTSQKVGTPIKILQVEDSPGDVRLTKEAFKDAEIPVKLRAVPDGIEALAFLRRQGDYDRAARPDLILLDLNLPKMSGHQVLKEIKDDPDLKYIPVFILTVSQAREDILKACELHANCYITKPIDLNEFTEVVKSIQDFWLTSVKLPTYEEK
jgi:chemotaxis family two-component system response regulator Rcp1